MSQTAYATNQFIENLLQEQGSDPRKYTSDQRKRLREFTGYGGLDKYGAKGIGILYEYYTPKPIIQKMWALALKHGFRGGYVQEPSAGIGDFIGLAPDPKLLQKPLYFHAIEINETSAAILRILYPEVKLDVMAYEQLFLKDNKSVKGNVAERYDLVIGNPPYGSVKGFSGGKYFNMGEGSYTEANSYDEYFMLRGLDVLKPGGLLIFIIGSEVANGGVPFLKRDWTKAKQKIAEKGELLEAWRLPNGVFDRTDVLSDILVIQKK